jgi:hypothetical protein
MATVSDCKRRQFIRYHPGRPIAPLAVPGWFAWSGVKEFAR